MGKDSLLGTLEVMTEREFNLFSQFIHTNLGIKMPSQKKSMLEARLRKRLRALGLASFKDYREFVFSPEGLAKELSHFCDVVTTNKTDFFREPAHFDYLVLEALPELIRLRGAGMASPLRVWSAGCSSGEEPYTLAMVLSEFAAGRPGFHFEIQGTDLSGRVLEAARTAIYSMERAAPIPQPLKRKYLLRSRDRSHEQVRMTPELRSLVRFRRLNFMDENYGFNQTMDIIFCRNVIIYFDRPTQEKIVDRICRHLTPGGFIFMGHSETLNGMNLPLSQAAPSVYRKRPR